MIVQEQEQLFAALKEAHPAWTPRFTSGYVHGVNDESCRTRPKSSFVREAAVLDHYALGYLTGFALHRGVDAELEPWFGFVSLLVGDVKS